MIVIQRLRDCLVLKKLCREKTHLYAFFVDARPGRLEGIVFFISRVESKRMFNKECVLRKLCNTPVLCNVIYPLYYKLLATAR